MPITTINEKSKLENMTATKTKPGYRYENIKMNEFFKVGNKGYTEIKLYKEPGIKSLKFEIRYKEGEENGKPIYSYHGSIVETEINKLHTLNLKSGKVTFKLTKENKKNEYEIEITDKSNYKIK
jgi:hypothetical protein